MSLKKIVKAVKKMKKEGTLPDLKIETIKTEFVTLKIVRHPCFGEKNINLELVENFKLPDKPSAPERSKLVCKFPMSKRVLDVNGRIWGYSFCNGLIQWFYIGSTVQIK